MLPILDRHPGLAASLAPAGNLGVLSAAATGLDAFISGQGADAERVLGVAGIDPERMRHPTLSLDLGSYCRVMEEAAAQSHCDNFGLRYGQQFRPQALGLLGYIGLCSATLDDALRNFAAAFPLHQHDTLVRLSDGGDHYRFDYRVEHAAILGKRQDAELTMGMLLNLIRHVRGPAWAPRLLHFEHPRPEGWQEHQQLFDAPVLFNQPCNAMFIAKRDLAGQAMPEADAMLLLVMQDALARLGAQARRVPDLVEQARGRLHQHLLQGEPSLERLAAELDLGPQALQRRLRERGLSFSALVDEVRRELALHYLRKNLSISELAPLLGYSETSAFSRAFRRWFDVSPRQWRHHQN